MAEARPRRVLHIVQSLDTGGAERVVAEYALTHDRDRYQPEVCSFFEGGYLVRTLEEAGVPVHFLGRRAKLDIGAFLRLLRLLISRRFDVVHDHNFTALAIGAPAATVAGVRTLIRTEHNVVRQRRAGRHIMSRLAALREDAQIAVADAVRESHLAASRVPPRRFVTVRNGISGARLRTGDERAETRANLGVERDAVMCLSVGSLTRQKDFDNLLEAARRVTEELPGARFLVAGAGPEGDRLRARANELGVSEAVRFLGRTTDVPALLAASDIFVLPSAWEGLPITVLEAMAAGVPCVATRVGGVPEALEAGVSGLVVEPGDPDALARGVLELARDPARRAEMTSRARSSFEASFTAEVMTRQTEALYDLAASGNAHLAASGVIKVLYVIGQLSFGGAERQVAELAKRLPSDRYEPVVCCLSDGGPVADELTRAGVRVICIGKRGGVGSGASLALARLVNEERPAVMHSYLFSANWRTVLVGRLAGVPLVITSVRNVDIHGRPVFIALERMLSYLNDRVVANAEAVKDHVADSHGIRRDRISVILNGVSVERVATAAGRIDGPPTVLVVASLTPKKDHHTLLDAAALVCARLPDARFVLVGDGPLRGELERRSEELGISRNVEFGGELTDIGPALRQADLCALTSLKEGCSNFILESMLAGRPVVATDAGGNRELVEDGETGYVVALGDPEAVSSRMVEILSDPELATRMGESGRRRAERLFNVDRMVNETVTLYERTLRERVPGLVEWSMARAAREPGGGVPASETQGDASAEHVSEAEVGD